MKRKWAGCLVVALGLSAGGARAGEGTISVPAAETVAPGAKVVAAEPPAAGKPAAAPVLVPPGPGPAYVPGDHDHGCLAEESHGDGGNAYARVEYLLWWIKETTLPPLVTTGFATAAPAGAIGQPGTNVLFGGHEGPTDGFSGGRVTAGVSMGGGLGIEASYFQLEEKSQGFRIASNGDPTGNTTIIARPFFNTTTGLQDALLLSGPGVAGTVHAALSHRFLGAEANARFGAGSDCGNMRIAALAGFRFLSLDESLNIDDASGAVVPTTFHFGEFESFATRNRFYGGQVGIDAEFRSKRGLFAGATAKVALGCNDESVNINGATALFVPGLGTTTSDTSLLTGPNNHGSHTHTEFTWVPEINLRVGFALGHAVEVTVGYNFIYIGDVARPGNFIDLTNSAPLLAPTTAHPAFPGFSSSDFWAQGINVGVGVRF